MDRIYAASIARSLVSISESAERIAGALESLLLSDEKKRELVKISAKKATEESRRKLADTIRDILLEQVQENSLRQPPCPTEHTPNQDEESHPDEPDRKSDTPQHP